MIHHNILRFDQANFCLNPYYPNIRLQTYVHRVGRTGRAGRAGKAFTIARKEEMRHFKQMLQKAENTKQLKYKIDFDRIKSLEPHYKVTTLLLHYCVLASHGYYIAGSTKSS